MSTDPRIEAAAKAEFNSIWRGASWDGPVNPTTEETREKFRTATAAGLAAADKVMFSAENLSRAASALPLSMAQVLDVVAELRRGVS